MQSELQMKSDMINFSDLERAHATIKRSIQQSSEVSSGEMRNNSKAQQEMQIFDQKASKWQTKSVEATKQFHAEIENLNRLKERHSPLLNEFSGTDKLFRSYEEMLSSKSEHFNKFMKKYDQERQEMQDCVRRKNKELDEVFKNLTNFQ